MEETPCYLFFVNFICINNIFYEFHVAPAMVANEIAFNQAEEMHRMACQ